ncbi:MAG: Chitinase 1 [Bathelium mastoideum]|nr:MAG: Chitinase 1 [Bathelium mastoideum]
MLSSLPINVFAFLLMLFSQSAAGDKRYVPRRPQAPSVGGPSTTPSLQDAANALLSDAVALDPLPEDLIMFVQAVEDNINSLESELRGYSATPTPSPPSASSAPQIPSAPTTYPPPVVPPSYPPNSIPRLASPTSTSTSWITRTSTVQSTVSVYTTSKTTGLPAPTEASSSPDLTYTTTTLTSLTTTTLSNNTSTLSVGQITPTVVSPTSYQPSPSPSSPSGYVFNASATNNVAVYYGQTQNTTAAGLLTLCQDSSVDIIILAFLYEFFGPNNYPSAEFGPGCSISTPEQAQYAPGLVNCSKLAGEIAQCQSIGKPVLISLGGAIGSIAFSSDDQATDFAATIWNLFGGGGGNPSSSSSSSSVNYTGLRPFGDVVLDGFDIDNEDHNTAHYDVFATALRAQIESDPSRKYYISAAPQCPRPDASIPLAAMQAADFIWVQFYNNPPCNLGTGGFLESFQAWSADLAGNTSTGAGPRLFIGAGAWSGAGSGYVAGSDLAGVLDGVKSLDVPNFGGMMFWDGTEGLANQDATGEDFLDYAKQALS